MSVFVDMALLDRTVRIKYGDQVGSGLYVELNGICMIFTAAHVAKGMQGGDKLGVRFKSDWHMVDVLGMSACADGFDVCAIMPRTKWGEGLHEDQLDGALIVGQEVAYCGFPLSLEMHGIPGSLGWPKGFVKGAIFSGAIERPNGHEYLFDTINNRGFSGGPIIKREDGKLKVVGIVSGYKFDAPSPMYQKLADGSAEEVPDYFVKPNSGFMVGTPILRAINAAKVFTDLGNSASELFKPIA